MKKILLTLLVCAVFAISTSAQTNTSTKTATLKKDTTAYQKKNEFRISVGLDEGIPTAFVSKVSSFVMGASVQGESWCSKSLV